MEQTNASDSQFQQSRPVRPEDWSWAFWLAAPLYPYGKRRTICSEVVKETIWTFDQLQGILYVVVPIRMTVIKLEAGGLLVYAPVAPTPECVRLMNELVAAHGEVKYIILPTASAIEHKVFVGPFARKFPTAQVFVSPHQWSFPVNLPLSWLGFPAARTVRLPQDSHTVPFADEFDYAILGPIHLGLGIYEEVAMLHKRSRTLLITDAVLSVPAEPPAIVQLDPYALLFHAKDTAFDRVEDTPENRLKGWQRVSLFSFYFRPSALTVIKFGQAVRDALKAADRSQKAYFGLFPFAWKASWHQSFEALRGNGRLFVAPILQRLILNRNPAEAIAWADRVAGWDFQRIIPCHFAAPLDVAPSQFRQAFTFLEKRSIEFEVLPPEDFEFLEELEASLSRYGITPPRQEKV
jgi:Domain of unknown function (DUF4336)